MPQKFNLSKTIQAPAEKVFDYWLIPTFVGNWMFENDKIVELINEVKPRGSFSFKVSKDGKEKEYSGEYAEIRRPDRLAFSWTSSADPDQQSQVVVQFHSEENKTRVKFSQQINLESEQDLERIKNIWSRRLNTLSERLNRA